MNKRITSALAGLLMILGAVPMLAQSSDILDHYTVTLGTFLSNQDATLRVDGSGGTPGTPIDFNDTFGIGKSSTLARFGFDWRVGERHMVTFGGFRTSRHNSKRLTGNIQFGDKVFPIDTVVDGKLTTTFWDAAYTYYPYLRENRAFGVTGSLVTVSMSAKLMTDPASGSGTSTLSRRSSANLPAPGFGLSYRHRVGGNWQFDARASFLPKITIDKYNAKTSNMFGAVEYRFLNHYSLGVAYDYFSYTVGVDAENVSFSGSLKYAIQGPQAFGRIYW